MTESQQLDRYAHRRDAEAFALLVERYQRLIFCTCRRRLHHPADIDDAVQETFLRMAKAAGSMRSNVGGWLHRCATNVSTDLNRRRQTRLQYESQANPLQSSDAAQQELAELREHLEGALEKLNADERELIIQRYFVGRSQLELAAEAGVAPSTISLRLTRAIDNLRDHLKTSGYIVMAGLLVEGLEKETASAAISPALSANIARVGLSGVVAGTALLSLNTFLLTFLLICALLLGAFFYLSKSNQPAAQPAAGPPPAKSPVAMTVDGGNNAVSAPPKWLPTNAAPTATEPLSGQVLDRAGKPVEGALISLFGPSSATAKTNAQGRYAIDRKSLRDGAYKLGVTASGFDSIDYWTGLSPQVAISLNSPTVRNIVLDRGVVVSVQVRDNDGQPLANAQVLALNISLHSRQPRRATADQDGLCTMTLGVSKTPWVIAATANDYAADHQEVVCDSPDHPQDVDLNLSPGITVTGIATCADGKPATGWGISAQPIWSSGNVRTQTAPIDSTGKFSLEHILPGKYQLHIWRANEGQLLNEFTLRPAASAPLRVDVPGPSPAGLFKLTGKVRAEKTMNQSLFVSVSGSKLGTYFDKDVMVFQNGYHSAEDAQAGIDFTVNDVPAGTYQLSFYSPEIETTKVEKVTVPGDPVTVDLEVLGKSHLRATVQDPAGNPVTRFAVRIRQTEHLGNGSYWNQDDGWTQVTDPQGRFDLEVVGPGVYQAQISAPGFAWTWSPDARIEKLGQSATTVVKLTSGGTLSGTVLNPAGQPAVGAKIIPLSMSADITGRIKAFSGDAGLVLTDAQGRFTMPHLPPGTESVKITQPDCAPLVVSNLKIIDNQATDTGKLSLLRGASVEGTVYYNQGNASPGTVIDFQDDGEYHVMRGELEGHLFASAITDSAGHFRVDHLPPQDIYVMKSYLTSDTLDGVFRRTIHPVDGQTTKLDFGGPTPVRGRLIVAGKPAPQIQLTLAIGDPGMGSIVAYAKTDNDGKFAFFGPPPGAYSLYRQNADSFNRELLLGDFKLTDPLRDIGDVVQDTGEVTIHLNPDQAANVDGIEIENRDATDWWKQSLGSAVADAGDPSTWSNKTVSAGRMVVSIQLKGPGYRKYRIPFERKPGTPAISITAPPFPKPTATLVAKASTATEPHYITLRSDDDTTEVFVEDSSHPPQQIPVPPGTYHEVQPKLDRSPIHAVAGQVTSIDLSPPPY